MTNLTIVMNVAISKKFVSKQQGYTTNKTRQYPLQAGNVANEVTSANLSASNNALMQKKTIQRKLKKLRTSRPHLAVKVIQMVWLSKVMEVQYKARPTKK